ncbi:unnamed protein product [Ceutorhynchus assimilis]|uniref:1-acyl-sn-glycerol-3-phosphate acyltransferase n=1 Tax=Ceutorhynchus assimilis TaxID=467358 RepID=A0A9N9MHQ3_9CUCU|nr:unnamed protein product [Ceutorhynchus assimilis]
MGWLVYLLAVLVVITLIYNSSSVARYYMKWIFFVYMSGAAATLPMPLMCLNPKDPKNALIPAAGLRMICNVLGISLKVEGHENIVQDSGCVVLINHQSCLDLVGFTIPLMIFRPKSPKNCIFFTTTMRLLAPLFEIKLHLEGHENIVKDSGCVVLMNHQSLLDLYIVSCLWPLMENCTPVAKRSVLFIPLFGIAAWLWGTVFISRGSKEGQNSLNKAGELMARKNAHVMIFPEGTRNLGDKLLPFKKGSFHLAVDTQMPIQPVVACRYKFLKNSRFDRGEIKIRILPAIPTKGCTKEDIPKLIDTAYKSMSTNIDELSSDDT